MVVKNDVLHGEEKVKENGVMDDSPVEVDWF
jgi:hypothetical protein